MWVTVIVVGVVVVLVGAVYAWPLRTRRLRRAPAAGWDYAAALAAGEKAVAADAGDAAVLPDGRTTLLTHGRRTARSVVLFHGYTGCPWELSELARFLYEAGYNVVVPREPHHGIVAGEAVPGLTAAGLIAYANDALDVAAGLGDEVGVIGHSGGADLAVWLATNRTDVVRRLLIFNPFFRPAAAHAPRIAIKPLTVLHGHRLLPDRRVPGTGQRYRELSQYLRVAANFGRTNRLVSAALVVADGDDQIHRPLAESVVTRVAGAAGLTPAILRLDHTYGHNVVEPRNAPLYPAYRSLYESTYH